MFSTVSGFISNAFVNTFNSFYESKVEETKTNKLVKSFGIVVIICSIGIIFFTLKENFVTDNKVQTVKIEKEKSKKIEKEKEIKKKVEKKTSKKKLKKNK